MFEVEFIGHSDVGRYGDWVIPPKAVVDEICFRTPGFNGWQQEKWYTHCNDAAIFVGFAGKPELESMDRAAYEFIKSESGYDEAQWTYYFDQMDINGSPLAYLFRCRHCGAWGGYSDCD